MSKHLFDFHKSPKARQLRVLVFRRAKGKCQAPGCKYEVAISADYDGKAGLGKLVLNHTVPVSLGGDKWDANNLKALCLSCSTSKGKSLESEWWRYADWHLKLCEDEAG